jgi:nitrite reductase/ring-hydroxylating ferredoxin subunit
MITVVRAADNAVAIFNVDGKLFAIDDWCLRCGASLASGALRGRRVICSRREAT